MVVELLQQASVQRVKIVNWTSSLAVASNADVKLFPGRNSGLHGRSRPHDVPQLCKLQAGLKLLNISLAASFLVVLTGDVSLNPGSKTDPCVLCAKGCRKNQRAVQCDECDRWFHSKCIIMNHREYHESSWISWLGHKLVLYGLSISRTFFSYKCFLRPKNYSANDSIDAPKVRLVRRLKILTGQSVNRFHCVK